MATSILPIRMSITMVYAIKGESVTVIDGGAFSNLDKYKKGIEKSFIKPEEVKLIVLTHGHFDHISSAKAIKELTGAKVLLHQDDMDLLVETNPPQSPSVNICG